MADRFKATSSVELDDGDDRWAIAERLTTKVASLLEQVDGELHVGELDGTAVDGSNLSRDTLSALREAFETNDLVPDHIHRVITVDDYETPGVFPERIVHVSMWIFFHRYVTSASLDIESGNSLLTRGLRERSQEFMMAMDRGPLADMPAPELLPPERSERKISPTPAPEPVAPKVAVEPPSKSWWSDHWLGVLVLGIVGAVAAGGILKALGWV